MEDGGEAVGCDVVAEVVGTDVGIEEVGCDVVGAMVGAEVGSEEVGETVGLRRGRNSGGRGGRDRARGLRTEWHSERGGFAVRISMIARALRTE
jgi:hypothetical protein